MDGQGKSTAFSAGTETAVLVMDVAGAVTDVINALSRNGITIGKMDEVFDQAKKIVLFTSRIDAQRCQ